MGGRCIPQLTDQVTHLVTNNVKSAKYEVIIKKSMHYVQIILLILYNEISASRTIKKSNYETRMGN